MLLKLSSPMILQYWGTVGYYVSNCTPTKVRSQNLKYKMPPRERRSPKEIGRKLSRAQRTKLRPILLAKLDDASNKIHYEELSKLKLFQEFQGRRLIHLINTEMADLRRQREIAERQEARKLGEERTQNALVKEAAVFKQKLEAQKIITDAATASAQNAKANAASLEKEVKAFRAGPDMEAEMRGLLDEYRGVHRSTPMRAVIEQIAQAFGGRGTRTSGTQTVDWRSTQRNLCKIGGPSAINWPTTPTTTCNCLSTKRTPR